MGGVLFLAVTSCGTGADEGKAAVVGEEAVLTYGHGPSRDGSMVYQPDVVLIEGGAAAIRSASADGLVWTIDRSARGASGLKTGAVMFATSIAVGRVVELRDEGDSRVVTLAPVDITEVVRDGTIKVEQDIAPAALVYHHVPALPGAVAEETGAGAPSRSGNRAPPPMSIAAASPLRAPPISTLPGVSKQSLTVPVGIGGWTAKPYVQTGKLGLGIERAEGSLKVAIDLAFTTENLHVSSDMEIRGGRTVRSGFVIEGIKGLDVTLSAGAGQGSADNSKIKAEVPVTIDIPVPPAVTGGLPMNVKATYTFIVETALTGKNSTLVGAGKYKLDGPIGISGGVIRKPTFAVQQSIIDSLSGITLGPSGIVIAVKMKLMVGIGTPAASAGPFGTVTASLGLTNGSSLGAPVARCRGASLEVKVGGGAGLSVSPSVVDALKKILPAKTKFEASLESSTTVIKRSQVVPDVPLCQGAMQ